MAHTQTPCDSTRFNDTFLDKLIGYGNPSPFYLQIAGDI